MRKRIEFELLDSLMCGGVRVADNFLESENYIRGSVLRAAFASEILLECPLADCKGKNGENNFIELKEPDGRCSCCPKRKICSSFSDMFFSFAYPMGAMPAPFTAKTCKTAGLYHRMQDTICQRDRRLICADCTNGLKRMETVKGLIRDNGLRYENVRINRTLSTHTAIDYNTHTAEEGNLYTVKAIPKGITYTAVIDDRDSDLIAVGNVIYVGKYSSNGFGKMRICSAHELELVTEEKIEEDIHDFQEKLNEPNKASLLFMSDSLLDFPQSNKVLSTKEYINLWQKAILGDDETSLRVDKVFAETELYSGYNTSREWGNWKDDKPILLVKKGTSVLLDVIDINRAVTVLKELIENGLGKRTSDGFGEVAVCHPIHRLGVYSE